MAVSTGLGLLIGGLLAAGGTGVQVSESRTASRRATRRGEEQERKAKSLRETARAEDEQARASEGATRTRAASRARQRARAGTSRRDTILTGPSGVTGQSTGTRKTLLGA